MSLTVDAFLDVVMGEIGYHEQAPKTKDGKPWTKYGEWWDKRHKTKGYITGAWCDMFLAWCAYQAGGEDGLKIIGEFAYTPDHARWFARNGRWGNTPTKGALVFFDWGGSKDINKIDHVGVVIGTDSLGRIVTIEGNTSDQVAKRYRYRDCVVGYGYPVYAKASTTRTTTTKTASPKYPLAANDWFSSTRNSRHPAVKQIQAQLVKHGYKIAVDGIYGPKTTAAVKSFQTKAKVTADGAVGPITWPLLWTVPTK